MELASMRAGLLLLCLAAGRGAAQTHSILHQFTGPDGASPGRLALSGTTLFGTTGSGGSSNRGAVFKLDTDGGGFTVLKEFAGGDGAGPGGLVLSGTTLYGTTGSGGSSNCGTVFKLGTDGSGFTVLKEFAGSDGAGPGNLLLSGTTLYGNTDGGGISNVGTLFKLNTDGGGFAVIKEFTDPDGGPGGVDGCRPRGSLALAGTTLYGTTVIGGVSGAGVVFKVNSDGSGYTVLKQGDRNLGGFFQGVILSETTLYVTALWASTCGEIYRLNTDGSGFTKLRRFADFEMPQSPLVLSGSMLFGSTPQGLDRPTGLTANGGVFMLDTEGGHFTWLEHFNGTNGSRPGSLVISGTTLYGTTASGGRSNCGTVFGLALPVPAILTPPQSQTAEVDSTVQFSTGAEGLQPLAYRWIFNGTDVLSSRTQAVLRLTHVQPTQVGAYTVVVTNVLGVVTSPPAMLSVIPRVERRMVVGVCLRGEPGSSVNLECTDGLSFPPDWVPFAVVALANSPHFCFDLSQPLPPQRFFRAWHTGAPAVAPSLNLGLVPAVTVSGAIGSRVRVDGINPIGPIDAWVPLDTVTLTNTSQLYFDVSAPPQPQRLYRLVPVP